MIGDVRGHGLAAIGEASLVLSAFREGTHRCASLLDLVAALDDSVSRNVDDVADTKHDPGEHFITCLVLEIPDEGSGAEMVNCGHPPPLLVTDQQVTVLHARRPLPPLGMGELPAEARRTDPFTFQAGDMLVLYTDGVIEARSPARAFYPLAERVASFPAAGPDDLLDRIHHDLLAHIGGPPVDDAAILVIEHTPRTTSFGPAPTRKASTAPPAPHQRHIPTPGQLKLVDRRHHPNTGGCRNEGSAPRASRDIQAPRGCRALIFSPRSSWPAVSAPSPSWSQPSSSASASAWSPRRGTPWTGPRIRSARPSGRGHCPAVQARSLGELEALAQVIPPEVCEQRRAVAWNETDTNRGGRTAGRPKKVGLFPDEGPLGRLVAELSGDDALAYEVHPATDIPGRPGTDRLPPCPPTSPGTRPSPESDGASAMGGHSQLVVLVGESSRGKTRACWEAVRTLPPDWRI